MVFAIDGSKAEVQNSDESMELMHHPARLSKIKQNPPKIIETLQSKKYTTTRIIVSRLPSNNEIALMPNLPFEICGKEIESPYFKRWEIEKKYH